MREYRQDSHTGPLVAWTLLCVAVAGFLFVHARRIPHRVLAFEEVLAGAGLLVVGPVALAVYLYRARHVWVAVDPARGLVVSGRRVIPWEEIVRVERRRPRLRKDAGPVELRRVGDLSSGCLDLPGCAVGGGELGAAVLGLLVVLVAAVFVIWLIVFVVVPLLVIPWLEIFAPFGDRVRVVLREGRPLVLRDLRGADDFMLLLPASVPRR